MTIEYRLIGGPDDGETGTLARDIDGAPATITAGIGDGDRTVYARCYQDASGVYVYVEQATWERSARITEQRHADASWTVWHCPGCGTTINTRPVVTGDLEGVPECSGPDTAPHGWWRMVALRDIP